MTANTGRILGIDYGTKRIGVAVSDPLRVIAQGVTTLDYRRLPEVVSRLGEIAKDYDVTEAVVGYPISLGGGQNESMNKVESFLDEFKKQSCLKVTLVDERFTSKMAQDTMRQMGRSPSKHKAQVDKMAAAFILQTYLDQLAKQSSET